MNDRARAIRILQQARAALAERLTQQILEAEQEILDDANGHRYLSDIEQVYDQLGTRLAHVSVMLAHLPPIDAEPDDAPAFEATSPRPQWPSERSPAHGAFSPLGRAGFLALPSPGSVVRAHVDPAHDLHGFLGSIHRGDLPAAARLLGVLFDLDLPRAQRCADVFAVQAALRPELYTRVMRLKGAIEHFTVDEAVVLLDDCFGLVSSEATQVVKVLERRLGLSSDAQVR